MEKLSVCRFPERLLYFTGKLAETTRILGPKDVVAPPMFHLFYCVHGVGNNLVIKQINNRRPAGKFPDALFGGIDKKKLPERSRSRSTH